MTDEKPKEKPLPDPKGKQLTFALEYLQDQNATQAAIRAGYSRKTAGQIGYEHLKKPVIAAYIDRELRAKWVALHMGPDETMAEIAKLARFNMDDAVAETRDGDPYIDWNKLNRDQKAAVSEVEITDVVENRGKVDEATGMSLERTVRKVKLKTGKKLDALRTIAQHHGLTKDRVVHEIDEGFAELLMKGRRRAAMGEKHD
jgi:phage terminase small subunit